MKIKQDTYQIAIVGGGPVGLFLGSRLHQAGISCVVLEKRAAAVTHSRSIGIHPVSLELFEKVDLAESFTNHGVKVKQGMAYVGREHVATLSFNTCPPPYSFILTLPQYKTEELLASHLNALDPEILQYNRAVISIAKTGDSFTLETEFEGKNKTITAEYVVGCDGKNSIVRQFASISFTENAYNDTYIMGDFSDNTGWENKAAIMLCSKGLIESFPLANNKRRWVAKTEQYLPDVHRRDLEKRIARRIGHDLTETDNFMLSSFGVQKALAQTMAKGKIALAGDAAHIISPIGGQGMNLGWMDADDLANCFGKIFNGSYQPEKILEAYSKRRLKIARKVIRRAEFNMRLGRKTKHPFLKKMVLKTLLKTPFSTLMARLFTMRGLHSLPF